MSLADLTKKNSGGPPLEIARRGRHRSYAWVLPTGLLLGFVIILALLFGNRLLPGIAVEVAPVVTVRAGEPLSPSGEPGPSEGMEVGAGRGELLFQASGWIEPDPFPTYVSTLTNGVVDEVHALEGQSVKRGDLVATLIDDDARLDFLAAELKLVSQEKKIVAHGTGFEVLRAEMTAAQRKIEALETQLAEARDTSARFARLSKGAVSEQQVVQAQLATERQVAMLAEAEAEIPRLEALSAQLRSEEAEMNAMLDELATARDRARLALDRTRITATIDGTVLRLHAAPGMKKMLGMDSPTSAVIVELYDPDQLQARIDVPLNEAGALSVGQVVELVSDLLPDRNFTGRVTRISGQADLQRNTLQAKVAIAEPDRRLRPEMLVRARFFAVGAAPSPGGTPVTSPGRLALYVPEIALVNENEVWVVSPRQTAERRRIELGSKTKQDHRLVLQGLRSGESVILPPHADLEEGSRVRISKTDL